MKRVALTALALTLIVATALVAADKKAETKKAVKTVVVGAQAPSFIIKDTSGKQIDLKKLSAKGPVLVRLTCGCSGCDKELAYFQELHKAYKGKGLTSLAVFREPDKKVEAYVKKKNLTMMYAVDTKGTSWKVFETTTMPTNFLIEKGGRIISIANGCDPTGLLATKLSEKVAKLVDSKAVNVQETVQAKNKK